MNLSVIKMHGTPIKITTGVHRFW